MIYNNTISVVTTDYDETGEFYLCDMCGKHFKTYSEAKMCEVSCSRYDLN